MATNRQKAYQYISYFLSKYKEKYGAVPKAFNRHSLAYGFEGLVADYPGHEEQIIDFFFENYHDNSPTKFTYQYGNIVDAINDYEEDKAARQEARRRTRERMKNVNSSQSNQGGSA